MAGTINSGMYSQTTDISNVIYSKDGAVAGVVDNAQRPQFSPYILAQSAVPTILPSSGSSNATGQITLTTALPYTPSGTVQIYLPTGVVTAGSAGTGAGLYPVVFSSTTVCQVQGTGIVSANGAYTQTTGSDLTLATITVPGGSMGANGALRGTEITNVNNSANNKIVKAFLGSQVFMTSAQTTVASWVGGFGFRNRGAQNVNVVIASGTGGSTAFAFGSSSSGGANMPTAVDTSVNQNLTLTGQLATATDYIMLDGYTVEVLPG